MLFAIEFLDAVAGFVVLTETILLLLLVKEGVVVPGGSVLGVGTSVINFAFQNVDCTRNGVRDHSHKDARKSQA